MRGDHQTSAVVRKRGPWALSKRPPRKRRKGTEVARAVDPAAAVAWKGRRLSPELAVALQSAMDGVLVGASDPAEGAVDTIGRDPLFARCFDKKIRDWVRSRCGAEMSRLLDTWWGGGGKGDWAERDPALKVDKAALNASKVAHVPGAWIAQIVAWIKRRRKADKLESDVAATERVPRHQGP